MFYCWNPFLLITISINNSYMEIPKVYYHRDTKRVLTMKLLYDVHACKLWLFCDGCIGFLDFSIVGCDYTRTWAPKKLSKVLISIHVLLLKQKNKIEGFLLVRSSCSGHSIESLIQTLYQQMLCFFKYELQRYHVEHKERDKLYKGARFEHCITIHFHCVKGRISWCPQRAPISPFTNTFIRQIMSWRIMLAISLSSIVSKCFHAHIYLLIN
jgi:hypothetical protein